MYRTRTSSTGQAGGLYNEGGRAVGGAAESRLTTEKKETEWHVISA